jgi:tyrosyl-tRNA synthetase
MTAHSEDLKAIRRGVTDVLNEDELVSKLSSSASDNRPLRVKLGIDPTSPDIHLGHTVVLGKLRQFQDLGHHAVLIIGDYTALVGDPSGRTKTRPQLSEQDVQVNARTYLEQVGRIIDLDKAEVVRNGDWFRGLAFSELLSLASKMTVARMLERDDFSKRYKEGNPIGLHEFIYPLMQGYDSVMVKADVELGATDQTFNLLVGRDLQRDAGQEPQVCITMPMLVGTDGTLKMSKSYGNHIGISDDARDMFGKCMSIPDALMKNYFELLTPVPMEEVDSLLAGHPRDAKDRLAREIVARFHNEEAAAREAEEFKRVFAGGEVPQDMPEITLPADMLEDGGIWIVKLLTHCALAGSGGEARRLISQGAVKLGEEAISDVEASVAPKDGDILRAGKRRFARIVVG